MIKLALAYFKDSSTHVDNKAIVTVLDLIVCCHYQTKKFPPTCD